MSYLLGICRLTPALLIFMKFSKHSGENSDVKNQHLFEIGKIWQNETCCVRTISLTVS